jgi:release factor glutamine methyltransferase
MPEPLGSLLSEAAAALSEAGFDEPRRCARQLVTASLDLSPTELLSHPDRRVERSAVKRLRSSLARMVGGEPMSRILGWREFWGLRFALSADTLDPRAESETLVEAVLRRIPDRSAPLSFLDLGTGSGCLLLALLSEFPAAIGVGVDIAAGAVVTARENAAVLGLAGRARFFVGDWGSALLGRFGVIIANPPYIAGVALAGLSLEVRRYDPRRAVDGGEDGHAAYRRITKDLPALLASGGIFVVEIGTEQALSAAAILEAGGLWIDGIERDLAGIERCIVARVDEATGPRRPRPGQKNLGMCHRPV